MAEVDLNKMRGNQLRECRKRDDLHILVFDVAGFVRHRVFTTISKQGWDEDYTDSAKAQDGNRTIVFKSPEGLKKYDVISNIVTAAK
jgi:hypothetical protein